MSQRDYYEVLGVSKTSTDAELKKAYRRLAMKYHPDRNTAGDEESEHKFKEAKEAYEILSDGQQRAAYDQYGHAGVDPQSGMGGGPGGCDYWTHLLSWWARREQSDTLLATYRWAAKNRRAMIERLAAFLDLPVDAAQVERP